MKNKPSEEIPKIVERIIWALFLGMLAYATVVWLAIIILSYAAK
jgi:hypothetical protein